MNLQEQIKDASDKKHKLRCWSQRVGVVAASLDFPIESKERGSNWAASIDVSKPELTIDVVHSSRYQVRGSEEAMEVLDHTTDKHVFEWLGIEGSHNYSVVRDEGNTFEFSMQDLLDNDGCEEEQETDDCIKPSPFYDYNESHEESDQQVYKDADRYKQKSLESSTKEEVSDEIDYEGEIALDDFFAPYNEFLERIKQNRYKDLDHNRQKLLEKSFSSNANIAWFQLNDSGYICDYDLVDKQSSWKPDFKLVYSAVDLDDKGNMILPDWVDNDVFLVPFEERKGYSDARIEKNYKKMIEKSRILFETVGSISHNGVPYGELHDNKRAVLEHFLDTSLPLAWFKKNENGLVADYGLIPKDFSYVFKKSLIYDVVAFAENGDLVLPAWVHLASGVVGEDTRPNCKKMDL